MNSRLCGWGGQAGRRAREAVLAMCLTQDSACSQHEGALRSAGSATAPTPALQRTAHAGAHLISTEPTTIPTK